MPIDMLSIVVNSQWQTEQVQLGYHATRLVPPDSNGVGRIIEMKNASGWPADYNYYDDKYIYFTATEADPPYRDDDSCYKLNLGPNGRGFPVLPRFFDPGQLPWRNELFGKRLADSTYVVYQGCKAIVAKRLGTMECSFNGPFPFAWGGDIGDAQGYVLDYKYDSGASRERFIYLMRPTSGSYGWCGWDVAKNGLIKDTSYRNRLVRVAPPMPKNPCHL
jgi:hypothetical protein